MPRFAIWYHSPEGPSGYDVRIANYMSEAVEYCEAMFGAIVYKAELIQDSHGEN